MSNHYREDKIFNNSYNNLSPNQMPVYRSGISIDPAYEDRYKESTTGDISGLYETGDLEQLIYSVFKDSPYYDTLRHDEESIGNLRRRLQDMIDIFYYMLGATLSKNARFSKYEIILGIAEFFEFSYSTLWDKILSPELKNLILETVDRDSTKQKSKSLF